nr:hypothetical protein [uncultured Caproiciproducens sp.]
MNIKSKKFLTVIITLIFAVTVFTLTAFAESNTTSVDPPAQEVTGAVVGNSSSQSAGSPESSSQVSSEPTGSTSESSPSGSEVPQSGGESSQTGSSSEAASSSSAHTATSSSKAPVVNHNVDTHANEVEARASQAAQTISDPAVLSSQNWGELLSSGESAASETAADVGTVSSEAGATPGIGGVSWLLVLGVVLIVLALCGIGLFVYLQFFFKGNSSGGLKFAPAAAAAAAKTDEPLTFEDISSDSSKLQRREDSAFEDTQTGTDIQSSSVPAIKTAPAVKPQQARKPVKSDKEITAPIPQEILSRNGSASPSSDRIPKSQATPVKDSNFDWEKFFNDEKK